MSQCICRHFACCVAFALLREAMNAVLLTDTRATAHRIRHSVEAATANAAKEAARADALARAARRVEGGTPLLRDVDRLKARCLCHRM